ncbi:MAG TPA: hypothetical protein VK870_00450 [Ignavibacteriaceae bacterium]|nr:hypothetical protein [Ignavibacteriaceae bacterium]
MKSVVVYSPDFSLCYSLLMFLQNHYKVVATTSLDAVSAMIRNSSADLVILDSEPNEIIESLLKEVKNINCQTPIVLTYVYNSKLSVVENKIKPSVKEIFYKPFDLNEISTRIPNLLNAV